MKKIFAIFILITLLSSFLTSCKPTEIQNFSSDAESENSAVSELMTEQTSSDASASVNANEQNVSSQTENKPLSSNKSSSKNSSTNKASSDKSISSEKETVSIPSVPTYPDITPSGEDYKEITPVSRENYYGWQYLKNNGTTAEQKTYKAFEDAFSNYEKTVTFDFKVNAQQVEKVYEIYIDDHPEEFFLGAATYNTDSRNNVANFTVKSEMMSLSKDKIAEIKNKAQQKAYDIILELFPNGVYKNEIETVRAVHDYLIDNVKYDTTYNADHSHDMYGSLINGTSVCEGYAEAFLYIMRLCGIECLLVNGTMSSVSHVWNMVKLENEWYHIDITSDDPILKNAEQVLRFEYFNLTDDEIKKTHIIEENVVDIPAAVVTKYNFFKYYGLEYSDISVDVFVYSISFSMKNGYNTAYFKFTNNTPDQAIDYYLKNSKTIALIVNNNRLGKKIESGGTVSYSQSKQKNILNMKLKYQ